jgi:hypothetical protein
MFKLPVTCTVPNIFIVFNFELDTVDSRYYNTVGIRKMYQYIQTINITSINFYNLVMFGRQIWYRSNKHFDITDIITSREHCILKLRQNSIKVHHILSRCEHRILALHQQILQLMGLISTSLQGKCGLFLLVYQHWCCKSIKHLGWDSSPGELCFINSVQQVSQCKIPSVSDK